MIACGMDSSGFLPFTVCSEDIAKPITHFIAGSVVEMKCVTLRWGERCHLQKKCMHQKVEPPELDDKLV
jgi:hypothetical protein